MKKYYLPFIILFFFVISLQAQKAIDSICVFKAKREMQVFFQKKLVKTLNIGLGNSPEGAKHFQGDGRTPEGKYYVNGKNSKSKYNKALCISYPEFKDALYAKLQKMPAGNNICIHGLPEGYVDEGVRKGMTDWTAGCIAIKNADINYLFPLVNLSCVVNILP